VGTAVLEVVIGDGSLTPEVSPGGDTNVTVGATAADDPAASTGPTRCASPSTVVAHDDDAMEESGVILGHPIRAPVEVSLDEAMGTAHWALT
jgi:hypothetical protein